MLQYLPYILLYTIKLDQKHLWRHLALVNLKLKNFYSSEPNQNSLH